MDDNNFLLKLSQNLLEILDDDEYCDIIIEVGIDPYVKIFRAHMNILNYRSPYLKRILSTNKKKDDGTLVQIKLQNISPEIFQLILRYIYGGRLSLKEYDTSDIIKILIAASELSLQELVGYLQSFLIKNQGNWMEQNFDSIYKTSFENDSFLELQKYCTDLISKEPDKIFKSPNFSSISEKILVAIIRNDNLQLKEIQIWERVLEWGIAQNPELSSDPKSFSKDDFNILRNTLQQCIPFIKFYNLTSKEFFNKVYPYKKIIPKELRETLFKHFLDRDDESTKSEQKITKEVSSKNIDSRIITFQHAELISKWIDRLEITDEIKNSYKFDLILRGSRDGFTPEKFQEICNRKSHTVSIIKVKNSNEILGGYNPIAWNNWFNVFNVLGSFGKTKDSFIFSFKNNNNIENHILSRVAREKNAIYYLYGIGPSFNSDLSLQGSYNYNYSSCTKRAYVNNIRETSDYFSVEEYEIFEIVKD